MRGLSNLNIISCFLWCVSPLLSGDDDTRSDWLASKLDDEMFRVGRPEIRLSLFYLIWGFVLFWVIPFFFLLGLLMFQDATGCQISKLSPFLLVLPNYKLERGLISRDGSLLPPRGGLITLIALLELMLYKCPASVLPLIMITCTDLWKRFSDLLRQIGVINLGNLNSFIAFCIASQR